MSTTPTIRLSVIGATGSVGSSILKICRLFPERFSIHSLCACTNVDKMVSLIHEFNPVKVVMTDLDSALSVRNMAGSVCKVMAGLESLEELVTDRNVDQVVFASSGTDAIPALQKALLADKDISLANKESIVVAGPWVMPLVKRTDQLRPLDSEHNAIWQCLRGEESDKVKRIYLTASGGPFKDLSLEELRFVTPLMAIKHPVWNMGHKISVDSSTLMNKGIELIEAMNLFSLSSNQVSAVIHPRSFVHGMVQFTDHTIKMLAAYPDMSIPAATAMAYPDRLIIGGSTFPEYDFTNMEFSFKNPDLDRFPCLKLAMYAASRKGPYPALLVGADEVAVDSFLQGKITFMDIATIISKVFESWEGESPISLEDSIEILEWARTRAKSIVQYQ